MHAMSDAGWNGPDCPHRCAGWLRRWTPARGSRRVSSSSSLRQMDMRAGDVLFVGNQRNSDIAGGEASGLRTVYLADPIYRSPDDAPCTAEPTFTIATLADLPALVTRLNRRLGWETRSRGAPTM